MKHYQNWRPEYLGLFIAFLALNLWYLSSITINNAVFPVQYTIFIQIFFALSGPFFGVFFANKFHYEKLKKDSLSKEIISVRKALFVLRSQIKAINTLESIFQQNKSDAITYINKSDPKNLLNLEDYEFMVPILSKASPPHRNYDYKFDFNSIDFLLDENPELLFELSESETFFHSTVQFFDDRSDYHIREIQPKIEICINKYNLATIDQIKNSIGERISLTGQSKMGIVTQSIELSTISLQKSDRQLMSILVKRYPDHSFDHIKPKRDNFRYQ
ncbi:MAG: hypothetical protein HRU05_10900 [Oceanospirillaceae bacterium]|nr:hypothetical protein [Oceanospirillaceae bacterium]